jgi:hypothetical protein
VEYTVVFDVAQSGYRHGGFAASGLLVMCGALAVSAYRRLHGQDTPRLLVLLFCVFGPLWTIAVFGLTFSDYRSLSSALRDGRCAVVEGTISSFHPMPYSGHDMEWFIAGGERFEYSDHQITAGFNQTSSHGGPIRQGLPVRVHHIGNAIARLEIAR